MNLSFHPAFRTPSLGGGVNAILAQRVITGNQKRLSLRGLGDATQNQIASAVGSGVNTGTSIINAIEHPSANTIANAVQSGIYTASGIIAATGVGAPIAAAVAAFGTLMGTVIKMFGGCGATCTQATQYADIAGQQMDSAFYAYMSHPIHYRTAQQTYLILFDRIMAQLNQACGNPKLGAAGQRCVQERSASGCHWTTSPGGWSQGPTSGPSTLSANSSIYFPDNGWTYTDFGTSGSGSACFNPYVGRRDPVANDPTVVDDPVVDMVQNSDGSYSPSNSSSGSGGGTIDLSSITGALQSTVQIGSVKVPVLALLGGAALLFAAMD